MQFVDIERGHVLERSYHLRVAVGEAVVYARDGLGVGLGSFLSALAACLLDLLVHVLGIGKARIVGIDDGGEVFLAACHCLDLGVGIVAAEAAPALAALLQQPHARDVLEESGRTLDAALVGVVELRRLLGQDGLLCLDAHQAPCAAAQVGEVLVRGGHGGHGCGGVMAGHGYHRYLVYAQLLGYLGQQGAYYGARLCERQKHGGRDAQLGENLLVPRARGGVEHAGGRGYRILGEHLARAEVGE